MQGPFGANSAQFDEDPSQFIEEDMLAEDEESVPEGKLKYLYA